jgi:hypothetical protein
MKIWSIFFTGALVAILATSGCGPTLGEAFKKVETIPPKKALIYIYRPIGSVGFMYPIDVIANGKVVVTLAHGSYSPYLADPGEIEFKSKVTGAFSESLTLDAKTGQTYYMKTIIRAGVIVGQAILTTMTPEEGEREIGECQLVLDKKP